MANVDEEKTKILVLVVNDREVPVEEHQFLGRLWTESGAAAAVNPVRRREDLFRGDACCRRREELSRQSREDWETLSIHLKASLTTQPLRASMYLPVSERVTVLVI